MPIYQFLVHGRDPEALGNHGFYTTRHVHAADQRAAEAKVRSLLIDEFTAGVSVEAWSAVPPLLEIDEARRITWLQALQSPNRGSTFYREN